MTKKSPPERKGAEKPAAAQKPKTAPVEKPVADRKERTRGKVKKALEPQPESVKIPDFSETLSTKQGLKFVIKKYLRDCVKTPQEDLEETIRLTLQELSKENDESGRKLDSIYWFPEGTVIQIKDGKLFAKKREGKKVQTLISGKEIKVVAPEPTEEQPLTDDELVVETETPVAQPAAVTPDGAAAPTAEPTPVPAAPETTETAKPAPLAPELISLLTKTNTKLQQLRGEFEFFKSQPANIANLTDLGKQVTALGEALIALPNPQFKLGEVRLIRERIAALQVEIEDIINEAEKRAREIPGILKGLNDRINTLRDNADTWRTEVECIARSSRVPKQTEINSALEKYDTLLLAESDKLRGQINDIENSPIYNDELRAKLDSLKEQIRKISQSLEAPVRDLRDCLSRLPAPNGGQSNVIRLKPVRSSPSPKPVNADGVFNGESDSWITKALRWARFKK